jgi:hypothetical protein
VGFGVFEKFVDASPLQTEVRVIGQQGVEGQFEEAVQGTASGIDGGYAGRGKHYMLFLRIRADIFQEGRFARTCLARQEYGLTGILNEVQGILKLFVLCIGNEAQKISDL